MSVKELLAKWHKKFHYKVKIKINATAEKIEQITAKKEHSCDKAMPNLRRLG